MASIKTLVQVQDPGPEPTIPTLPQRPLYYLEWGQTTVEWWLGFDNQSRFFIYGQAGEAYDVDEVYGRALLDELSMEQRDIVQKWMKSQRIYWAAVEERLKARQAWDDWIFALSEEQMVLVLQRPDLSEEAQRYLDTLVRAGQL